MLLKLEEKKVILLAHRAGVEENRGHQEESAGDHAGQVEERRGPAPERTETQREGRAGALPRGAEHEHAPPDQRRCLVQGRRSPTEEAGESRASQMRKAGSERAPEPAKTARAATQRFNEADGAEPRDVSIGAEVQGPIGEEDQSQAGSDPKDP